MSEFKANILVVDDTPANVSLLSSMLSERGYKVRPAVNGELGLQAAQRLIPDLILLDINMPDINGYEVCERLKSQEATAQIPVIFLSALDDVKDKLLAFQAGGVDYITKPFQFEEVIARVETQLLLARQRQRIDELNRYKDQLLRMVSHDLKNPIGVVAGYADLIARDPGNVEKVMTYANRIMNVSSKMNSLVSDLLDLMHIEEGLPLDLQVIFLKDVVENIVHEFAFVSERKQLELILGNVPENLSLIADPRRLEQVMANLVSNAIKYTPEGGKVQIEVENAPEHVYIHVADTGYGIPQDALNRVFDKFYRVPHDAHLNQEGTGLGLSIVQQIIQRHHGMIHVASEVGVGSRFTIQLPLKLQAIAAQK